MGLDLSYCDFCEPGPESRWSEAARSTVNGVRATGRVDPYDDPMALGFQAPVPRHAKSARPPMRCFSHSIRCYNCGQPGHMRSVYPLPRRSPSPMPPSGFGQRMSRSPRTNAENFQPGRTSQLEVDSHGAVFTMRELDARPFFSPQKVDHSLPPDLWLKERNCWATP